MTYLRFYILSLLIITIGSCNQDQSARSAEKLSQPKLIKTIGSPRYGNVQCILEDKAGNLWFGTTENGLYQYDGKSFTRFLVGDGLISNNIHCMLQDRSGNIWIGTTAGLCMYDGKQFRPITIPLPKDLPPSNNPNYPSHWIFSIMEAKDGKLWFITIDGIYVYNGQSFTRFNIDGAKGGYLTNNGQAEYVVEDAAGNFWFGGRGNEGVFKYDGKSMSHLALPNLLQFGGPTPKPHNWAWPQLQDKNGHLWFSNWGGVYRYDGQSFTSFTEKDGLAGNMVTRTIEDKKGHLWFGGAGLSRYDGKTFTRFTTKDGIPNLGIWGSRIFFGGLALDSDFAFKIE